MKVLPQIQGIIRRRLLVNLRVEPEVIQRHLPTRFDPRFTMDGRSRGSASSVWRIFALGTCRKPSGWPAKMRLTELLLSGRIKGSLGKASTFPDATHSRSRTELREVPCFPGNIAKRDFRYTTAASG